MKKYQCEHYEPWRDQTPPLQMDECFHFIPQSGRCSCIDASKFNKPCPGEGYPLEPPPVKAIDKESKSVR